MAGSEWRAVQPSLAQALRDTRLQAHHAAQLATALGISYLPRRDDDSHTNLEWLPAFNALASNPVAAGSATVRVAVDVPRLSLLVLRNDRPLATQPLHGSTVAQAAAWLRTQLAAAGLNEGSFTLRKHYEIPEHPVARGAAFDASAGDAFAQLANWFHDGALALERLRASHPRASTVRCWPHHFDIGLVVDPGPPLSVGAGLEPGDVYYDEPYFYVNMRPAPPANALPATLAGGGQWHTHEWVGAVLTGSRFVAGVGTQEGQAGDFLASAVAAALAPVR